MARQHGITSTTYDKFIIDSGAMYTGFTDFSTPGTLMGATRDGASIAIETEYREMPVDGAHGPVKGSKRIVSSKATLTATFIEHTLANFIRALPGSESATAFTNWDAVTRALKIEAADYISNIVLIGEVSGNANAMGFKLSNVLCESNFELALTDKEEGVISLTFVAHFDPADLAAGTDTEPWTLYWPK